MLCAPPVKILPLLPFFSKLRPFSRSGLPPPTGNLREIDAGPFLVVPFGKSCGGFHPSAYHTMTSIWNSSDKTSEVFLLANCPHFIFSSTRSGLCIFESSEGRALSGFFPARSEICCASSLPLQRIRFLLSRVSQLAHCCCVVIV